MRDDDDYTLEAFTQHVASRLCSVFWLCFVVVVVVFTEEAVLGYVLINVPQVTSWLEVSPVGVEVVMCHGLVDAHAEAHTLTGEGVDGVHKLGVVGGQSVGGRHALKQRPRRVETWADGRRELRAAPQRRAKYIKDLHRSPVILPIFSGPSR